jgi:hypothetical protein
MEEDYHKTPASQVKPDALVLQRLATAVMEAEERNNYEAAHNEPLLKALAIVKKFIRTKGRVCYGGTAMNAILAPKDRFYDPETDLPDYDFFTPDPNKDVEELVADLKAAGFTEVYHRVGMHEGTKKILVNFVPIADISAIGEDIYGIMLKRAIKRGGIRYMDPDTLRMMMYLELSRPKGEVARWEKVFERLQLINRTFPPRARTVRIGDGPRHKDLPAAVQRSILDFCIEQQRILFTGDLDKFYRAVIEKNEKIFPVEGMREIVGFLSPNLRGDLKTLKESLGGDGHVAIILHKAKGEIVPEYAEIRYHGNPAVLILQEAACHSMLHFGTPDGRSIALASLDTLVTLYYAIGLFTRRAAALIPRVLAKVPVFIALAERNRRVRRPHVPAFPISCRGYQKGKATLLREKVERIKREKDAGSGSARSSSKTARSSSKTARSSSKTKTRKRSSR